MHSLFVALEFRTESHAVVHRFRVGSAADDLRLCFFASNGIISVEERGYEEAVRGDVKRMIAADFDELHTGRTVVLDRLFNLLYGISHGESHIYARSEMSVFGSAENVHTD